MSKANILDFFNCEFKIHYQKLLFKINDFSINMEDHNCKEENIYNDWITIYLDKELDLNTIKNLDKIYFDSINFELHINDIIYKINADEFHYFVNDFYGNFIQAVDNIMNYFCKWLKNKVYEE